MPNVRKTIDLNCDMGEGFGAWNMGSDEELLNHVSSANIACGFHAGDPTVIRKTVASAISKQVAVGAHPSYPDLQGFGRRSMNLTASEIFDIVVYQISAVKGIVESMGGRLNHVKPHGALYNDAANSGMIAAAIAKAVRACGKDLRLYGLSGSLLISEAGKAGLKTASEVFADRTYGDDGKLTPRTEPNALIESSEVSGAQVLQMLESGTVTSVSGKLIEIDAETICIHGDGENALDFARKLHKLVTDAGYKIQSI